MDVLKPTKSGELLQVGTDDAHDLIVESDDALLLALFDEACDPGIAIPVDETDPRGGFELVKLTPADPSTIVAFSAFLELHGFEVRDL